MTEQEVRDYVESAFQALKSRGWYADGTLVRAANTETDITAFETRRSLKLPRLYRAYLQSWRGTKSIRTSYAAHTIPSG